MGGLASASNDLFGSVAGRHYHSYGWLVIPAVEKKKEPSSLFNGKAFLPICHLNLQMITLTLVLGASINVYSILRFTILMYILCTLLLIPTYLPFGQ